MAADLGSARIAKRQVVDSLGDHPAVNGIGLAPLDGGYAVKVNLLWPVPDLEVPKQVGDVRVITTVTGPGFPETG